MFENNTPVESLHLQGKIEVLEQALRDSRKALHIARGGLVQGMQRPDAEAHAEMKKACDDTVHEGNRTDLVMV